MSDTEDQPKLKISSDAPPVNVPTFACIVYVSKVDGRVKARVANLPNLEFVGASERETLGKIVPEFKRTIADYLQNQTEIPWIEPPMQMASVEQKRFIPVHL